MQEVATSGSAHFRSVVIIPPCSSKFTNTESIRAGGAGGGRTGTVDEVRAGERRGRSVKKEEKKKKESKREQVRRENREERSIGDERKRQKE